MLSDCKVPAYLIYAYDIGNGCTHMYALSAMNGYMKIFRLQALNTRQEQRGILTDFMCQWLSSIVQKELPEKLKKVSDPDLMSAALDEELIEEIKKR